MRNIRRSPHPTFDYAQCNALVPLSVSGTERGKIKRRKAIAPFLHEVERGLGWSLSWVEVREAKEKFENTEFSANRCVRRFHIALETIITIRHPFSAKPILLNNPTKFLKESDS
jgi:hypothetical protein